VLFTDALTRIADALARPLPGDAAQLWMAPRPPRRFPAGFNPARVRHAAGLLLIFPRHDAAHLVLTERSHNLDRHRGQISLPGGVIEPGETHEQAALREAQEEIGLDPSDVRTIGALTSLDIPISGFRLHPVVAACTREPLFKHAHDEVARVLTVDLDTLMRAERIVWRTLTRDGQTIDFPAFPIDDVEIWGATAMVLSEFLTLLGWTGPNTTPP
jgi:8-oxo-dGTP pyrophosphatase MutT (NUDIX family)